jgi:hypothetical protein
MCYKYKICTNCCKLKENFNFSKTDKSVCRVCSIDKIFKVIENFKYPYDDCVIVLYIKDKLLGKCKFNIYKLD